MKLLAIGNSYSDDATAYLNAVAGADGVELTAINLYEGGCSLVRHMSNHKSNKAAYTYELNGVMTDRSVSIAQALEEESYDFITLQQASAFSGIYSSYYPYIRELYDAVRSAQVGARILFHQTWTYEYDYKSPAFEKYGSSQRQMHEAILDCSYRVAGEMGLDMIKSGEVIWALRCTPEFDAEHGGISLSRDGIHLDMTYGRLAAALSYYTVLTGKDPRENSFLPQGADKELVRMIRETVYSVHRGK